MYGQIDVLCMHGLAASWQKIFYCVDASEMTDAGCYS